MPANAFIIAATILAWTGASLLALAICADSFWQFIKRRRGTARRRCPKCWYDLSHAPVASDGAITCSECGRIVKRERQLYKGRRRWKLALLAVVMLLLGGYGLRTKTAVRERGLVAAVPTTVLILRMPWIEPSASFGGRYMIDQPPSTDLHDRLAHELAMHRSSPSSLWRWQERLLVDRCLKGDSARRPLDPQWSRFYGRILQELARRSITRPSWIDRAEALVEVDVQTRPRWPANLPIYASIYIHRWNEDVSHQALLKPRTKGLVEASAFVHSRSTMVSYTRTWSDRLDMLGTPPQDVDALVFDAIVERTEWPVWRSGRDFEETTHLCRQYELVVPIEIGGIVDDVLEPVEGPEIDEAVRTALDPLLSVDARGGDWRLSLRLFSWSKEAIAVFGALEGVTLAMTVEILRNGQVVGRGECWSRGEIRVFNEPMVTWSPSGSLSFRWEGAAMSQDDDWVLRLRSNPEMALRNLHSDRYWKGEIEVPLTVEVRER